MDNMRIGGCSCQKVPIDTKHWFCPTHGNCTRGITPEMGLRGALKAMTNEEKAREIVTKIYFYESGGPFRLTVAQRTPIFNEITEALASAEKKAYEKGREEGLALVRKHDTKRPDALDYYLKSTGMTEKEFYDIILAKRVEKFKNITPIIDESEKGKKKIIPFMQKLIGE